MNKDLLEKILFFNLDGDLVLFFDIVNFIVLNIKEKKW